MEAFKVPRLVIKKSGYQWTVVRQRNVDSIPRLTSANLARKAFTFFTVLSTNYIRKSTFSTNYIRKSLADQETGKIFFILFFSISSFFIPHQFISVYSLADSFFVSFVNLVFFSFPFFLHFPFFALLIYSFFAWFLSLFIHSLFLFIYFFPQFLYSFVLLSLFAWFFLFID